MVESSCLLSNSRINYGGYSTRFLNGKYWALWPQAIEHLLGVKHKRTRAVSEEVLLIILELTCMRLDIKPSKGPALSSC